MKQRVTFKHLHDIPPIAVSLGPMDWNKTGSWRYLRPRYVSRTPPCNEACPAGNDVEGFMVLTREGKPREAWELIREENPFPGICGRVCFHPCESSCNRREFDEPLAIHEIERFLADTQFHSKRGHHPPRRKRKENAAVIGSGPAGLTCAYHLARLGYGVTVFEAESSPGGILRHGIPEYRLPRAIVEREIADIQSWGVEIKTEARIGKDLAFENLRSFQAVFIATGAHGERNLNIEGEHLGGVFSGLEVLREIQAGRIAWLGKKVSVIGGGNGAIDVARSALRLGAETVQIFYRRSKEEMPAFPDEVEEALREGVQIHFLVSPTKIIGDGTKATGMECVQMRLGDADESGRRRPVAIEGSHVEVASDTIVAAIGEFPDLTFLPPGVSIQEGRIAINEMGLAHSRGVFAGGDAALADHTVAVAIGSGKKAALAIHEYLEGNEPGKIFQSIQVGEKGSVSVRKYFHPVEGVANPPVIPFQEIHANSFEHRPRVQAPGVPLEERRGNFHEVHPGLTREKAVEEACRCFNCGICNQCDTCWIFCPDMAVKKKKDHYEIDYDYCKGCGICFEECPRGAVLLEEEAR
jgi:2-oxoacid:acceptor oxidoreductase delta subunit (pyruvate/2-ketoisovalerate family)